MKLLQDNLLINWYYFLTKISLSFEPCFIIFKLFSYPVYDFALIAILGGKHGA